MLLLLRIQVMILQTTECPNDRALEDPIKHTIAYTCTLGHNEVTVTMLYWYNLILLHCSIALVINKALLLFHC